MTVLLARVLVTINREVFKQNPGQSISISGTTEKLALIKMHLTWQALYERLKA
jgi:hypothetical protein